MPVGFSDLRNNINEESQLTNDQSRACSPTRVCFPVLKHEMQFHNYPNQNNEIHGPDLLQDLTPQESLFPVFHGKAPDSASK